MKIYTSYFGRLKYLLSEGYIPVAICGKSPEWYDGLEYKKLAPSYNIWKGLKIDGCSEEDYTIRFKNEILAKLNPEEVVKDLIVLVGNSIGLQYAGSIGQINVYHDSLKSSDKIVLLCYEKNGEFCHRHLVSEWLKINGYTVEEVEKV